MLTLFRLFSHLPLPLLHALGTLAGWLTYLASPAYRQQLDANLARALGPDRARRLRWQAAAHAGRMVLELPAVWGRPLDRVRALVRATRGEAQLIEARAAGGVMVITPHLGCFELVGQYCAQLIPLTALYRPPRKAWLAPLMQAGRARGQMTQVPADLSGVRHLLRALKRGEGVGILPDQAPAFGEGVWADFFGASAYTMTLAARLMEQPRCTPILVWAERLSWGRGYVLHFEPLALPAGSLEARTAALNHALEQLILQCPAQYLWGYNRYKVPAGATPPERAPC